MKIAYFDCFSGISGDMILGALVDAGLSQQVLLDELNKLSLSGFTLEFAKVTKCGIGGTKVKVLTEESHTHRHLQDIFTILEQSRLDQEIIDTAKKIFSALAKAEAKIHNTTPDKIHFHEVGALDAIVDIVGAVIGLKKLGIEKIFASPLNLGSGFVNCEHGIMPVPAPATVELLKGIPGFTSTIKQELVTPTGAAIIATLAEDFGQMPNMVIECSGYGAGTRDLEIPNLLRIIIGKDEQKSAYHLEKVIMLETNIDDMNPEIFDFLFERLICEGALDISLTPIYMKKSRPATLLKVLAQEKNLDNLLRVIFTETTTLGVRTYPVNQFSLSMELMAIETKYGSIQIKVNKKDGKIEKFLPNYEDCRLLALKHNVPLKCIYDEINKSVLEKLSSQID